MSEDSVDQQREKRDVARLVRACIFAVDCFVMDHQDDLLQRVTSASRTNLVVEAAVGYLVGAGLIRVRPDDEWPEWLSLEIPDHLVPDLAGAIAEYARLSAALS